MAAHILHSKNDSRANSLPVETSSWHGSRIRLTPIEYCSRLSVCAELLEGLHHCSLAEVRPAPLLKEEIATTRGRGAARYGKIPGY